MEGTGCAVQRGAAGGGAGGAGTGGGIGFWELYGHISIASFPKKSKFILGFFRAHSLAQFGFSPAQFIQFSADYAEESREKQISREIDARFKLPGYM